MTDNPLCVCLVYVVCVCVCARACAASQVTLVVTNPPANAGDVRDVDLIPGSGRSPRGGRGNPLQYSCLENPMDRGAWQAIVHGVAKSWTRLKQLSRHMHVCVCVYAHTYDTHTYICLSHIVYPFICW